MKKVIIFSVSLLIGIACNTSVKNTDKAEITTTDSTEIINEEIIEEKASPDSLKDYFSEEKSNGKTWIQIKDAISADQNGFYIYFRKENNSAKGLRMRIQYADHDIYQFSVDGIKYTYKANKYKNSDARFVKGTGLNWYDFEVKRNDLKFLEAITKSENTRIIFSDGTSVPVTKDMKTGIQRTLDYFESLGGQLPRSNMVNIRRL
jgi:hypothetical protein